MCFLPETRTVIKESAKSFFSCYSDNKMVMKMMIRIYARKEDSTFLAVFER